MDLMGDRQIGAHSEDNPRRARTRAREAAVDVLDDVAALAQLAQNALGFLRRIQCPRPNGARRSRSSLRARPTNNVRATSLASSSARHKSITP